MVLTHATSSSWTWARRIPPDAAGPAADEGVRRFGRQGRGVRRQLERCRFSLGLAQQLGVGIDQVGPVGRRLYSFR